ncbi:hypothetical protein DXG01_016887 [Tephrocybe rancida]|nr:hypothetical protein DXG01_016887 [Tephrocybe rancida]
MSATFTYTFDTPTFKGTSTINTGLFINGAFVPPVDPTSTIDVVNPSTGKLITSVYLGDAADVDTAVNAALKAYKTTWGLKTPGTQRGRLLNKLADLLEDNLPEFAALEALNVGKFDPALDDQLLNTDLLLQGKVSPRHLGRWPAQSPFFVISQDVYKTNEDKLAYTRHEPYGVVGAITPWNFPLATLIVKLAPALATGNCLVLKPSEVTPLTALRFAALINEAGFPPGVVNIINGLGIAFPYHSHTSELIGVLGRVVGSAISEHSLIPKVSFTGSTLVGRSILRASSESNLKSVTLELGGKSPSIIFDDADVEQAVKWAALGILYVIHSLRSLSLDQDRLFSASTQAKYALQDLVYSCKRESMTRLSNNSPMSQMVSLAPQEIHSNQRVMAYIDAGKNDGAKVLVGGERHGTAGYFVQPTVFTDVTPDMKIVKEEIFGPVAAIIKFTSEEEAIAAANDTNYGLWCNVFSQNISRALRVAHAIEAGTALINASTTTEFSVPFGGYKQSGIGREMGDAALDTYTQVKAVHVNIGQKL